MSHPKPCRTHFMQSARGVSPTLLELLGTVGKLDPGSALDFFPFRSGGWHEWQRRWVINPLCCSFTSKCFQPHMALLLGSACRSSAPSLWGCNINKASLKVQQLLKLSWSLPITVTTQSVRHRNMFSAHNGQQTRGETATRAAGDTGKCGDKSIF